MANLEERLAIVRSARPVSARPPVREEPADEGFDGEEEEEDEVGRSKLDGLDLKELTVAQRRKVIMLRGKRERLERERRELEGDGE